MASYFWAANPEATLAAIGNQVGVVVVRAVGYPSRSLPLMGLGHLAGCAYSLLVALAWAWAIVYRVRPALSYKALMLTFAVTLVIISSGVPADGFIHTRGPVRSGDREPPRPTDHLVAHASPLRQHPVGLTGRMPRMQPQLDVQ